MKYQSIDLNVFRFDSEHDLGLAIQKIRRQKLDWEIVSPWPCDSLNEHSEHLGDVELRAAAVWGACIGLLGMLVWLYVTQWSVEPLITQGRTQGWDSWPVYIPPLFEATLLGAGLGILIGFLHRARLPRWYDRLFDCPFFRSGEEDGFYLIIFGTEPSEELQQQFGAVDFCRLESVKGGRK